MLSVVLFLAFLAATIAIVNPQFYDPKDPRFYSLRQRGSYMSPPPGANLKPIFDDRGHKIPLPPSSNEKKDTRAGDSPSPDFEDHEWHTPELYDMETQITRANKWPEFLEKLQESSAKANGQVLENWEEDAHKWANWVNNLNKKKTPVHSTTTLRTIMRIAESAENPSLGMEPYWTGAVAKQEQASGLGLNSMDETMNREDLRFRRLSLRKEDKALMYNQDLSKEETRLRTLYDLPKKNKEGSMNFLTKEENQLKMGHDELGLYLADPKNNKLPVEALQNNNGLSRYSRQAYWPPKDKMSLPPNQNKLLVSPNQNRGPPNFQNGHPPTQNGRLPNIQNEPNPFPKYQNGPSSGYQNGPQGYQNGPQGYQNGPQGYQNGPRGYQNGPQGYQNGPPMSYQNGPPQDYQNGPPAAYQKVPSMGYGNGPPSGYQNGPQGYQNVPQGYRNGPPMGNLNGPQIGYNNGPPMGNPNGPPMGYNNGPPMGSQNRPPTSYNNRPSMGYQNGPQRYQNVPSPDGPSPGYPNVPPPDYADGPPSNYDGRPPPQKSEENDKTPVLRMAETIPEPVPVTHPPPPRRTTSDPLASYNLPTEDDFYSPIRWVKFNSIQVVDGLAKVTDPDTGTNRQYMINGTYYVPIIDPTKIGGVETTTELIPVQTSTNSVRRQQPTDKELAKTRELGGLASQQRDNSPEKCNDNGCQSRCKTQHCKTYCYGDSCTAGCESDFCSAQCTGPGCKATCLGEHCTAKCDGMSCDTRCQGSECENECGGSQTPSNINGHTLQVGIPVLSTETSKDTLKYPDLSIDLLNKSANHMPKLHRRKGHGPKSKYNGDKRRMAGPGDDGDYGGGDLGGYGDNDILGDFMFREKPLEEGVLANNFGLQSDAYDYKDFAKVHQ